MIPIAPAVRVGLLLVSLVGGPIVRAVDRALRRKPAKLSPTCPACDDDPAERCAVCHRRQSRVEA